MLIVCLTPACSSFSKQNRQQAAYRKHVRKVQQDRKKLIAKSRKQKNRILDRILKQPMNPSAPTVTTSVE
jgi:hypothetical protein